MCVLSKFILPLDQLQILLQQSPMSGRVSLPIGLIKSVNPQSERKLGKRSCILLFQIPVCNDIKAKNAETAEIFSNPFSISAFKYSAGL